MPVDTPHPLYRAMLPRWQRVRDCIDGEDAVKARGQEYLPALSGAPEEYPSYIKRASFYGACERTVAGLAGSILRKPPKVEFPDEKFLERITIEGNELDDLLDVAVNEVTGIGRYGLLVDAAPKTPETPAPEPYVAEYPAESITNWKEGFVNGRRQLVKVVLREERVRTAKDEFEDETEEIYRVLSLRPNPGSPARRIYVQQIWHKEKKSDREEWVPELEIVPTMTGGRRLEEIPFEIINAGRPGARPVRPPLLALADVNLSHYRNSADLEHGRHHTALPTPWAAGFNVKKGEAGGQPDQLLIGPGSAWVADNPDAKAGMLEFTGEGLGHLQTGMEAKEKQMAVLGARMLEEQAKGVEAAETVRLRHSGEHSSLSRIAMSCSAGISRVLRRLAEWRGTAGNALLELNKDFNPLGLAPEMLAQLTAALQSGAISWTTFFWNMQRGEVIPEGTTQEDEAALIIEGPPAKPPAPGEEEEEEKPVPAGAGV